MAYSEPAETVISRSNEECVVALTNQWSITYGDPAWRDPVLEHVKGKKDFVGFEGALTNQTDPSFQTFSEGFFESCVCVCKCSFNVFSRMQNESGSYSGVDAALGNQPHVRSGHARSVG